MDDVVHMQTEMQASIDSQTSMMQDLIGHFGINFDCKIGGGAGSPGVSPHLSCFVPSFSSYLVTCLAYITTIVMTANKYCFT
jgi:hypothetical protein